MQAHTHTHTKRKKKNQPQKKKHQPNYLKETQIKIARLILPIHHNKKEITMFHKKKGKYNKPL